VDYCGCCLIYLYIIKDLATFDYKLGKNSGARAVYYIDSEWIDNNTKIIKKKEGITKIHLIKKYRLKELKKG